MRIQDLGMPGHLQRGNKRHILEWTLSIVRNKGKVSQERLFVLEIVQYIIQDLQESKVSQVTHISGLGQVCFCKFKNRLQALKVK